ncbi:MCE family protein [Rhodococcus erythropolis]|uniref:MCE family protein n=1 Tax=Rhodococcus erythropolis TaxID=1833 RepID=UPI001E37A70A|nr:MULTISPECIES: MCE family protein [Rhodococcus erythropolis group]MCD2107128.1 MCE family protein [Rhodococcus qingshengii]MCZ4526557.1 MCE family protein [Rhodococcus erythropolis]
MIDVKKALYLATAATTTMLVLSGCRFDGVNSLPLPGTALSGDTIEVTVEMKDIQNLVNNSVVKAGNVNVGAIRRVEIDDWNAKLTVELNSSAALPATVSATLGQTSILGAQYLELAVPDGADTSRPLRNGDTIRLDNTDEYPSTDQVLSALSAVLNGGGLQQLQTITTELNNVMDGRQEELRSLIGNLQVFVGGLNEQRDNIVRAIDNVDRLSATLGAQTATIDTGLTTITPALGVLAEQQTQLTGMLDSLGHFGAVADQVLSSSSDDLVTDLRNLAPVLTELAASGTNLPDALDLMLTVPFPVSTIDRTVRGDFVNLYLTVDLSANGVVNKILPSIPKGIAESIFSSTQAANPFLAPTLPARGEGN